MAKNFEVSINGAYHGSIVSENSGLAARSVLLNLGINEAETITVARSENGTVHEFIYHDCFLDGYTTDFVYEWKEAHTHEQMNMNQYLDELSMQELARYDELLNLGYATMVAWNMIIEERNEQEGEHMITTGDMLIEEEQEEKPFDTFAQIEALESEVYQAMQEQESVNTYFYCAVHTATSLTVTGNSYYCVDCGCTPQAIISADYPNPVTLNGDLTPVRWLDQAKASYPTTSDDIPSEPIAELPVMPDQAILEQWQEEFNEWGKIASTGTGVSLETSRVTDELELIIQCLEKHIWYDGKPGCEVRLLKLVNLFTGSMRKHMDNDSDWQACTSYQQELLLVRKAFLERYCEYARRVLFTNAGQEQPRIPVLA